MSEQLGKMEKPSSEEFKKGRKLYFVPLIYSGKEAPGEYLERFNKYWDQIEKQVSDLESKLGHIDRIYHEYIPASGEDGAKAIKELNEKSYQIVKNKLAAGSKLESIEETELLTEFMDWSKCLLTGLQNQKVLLKIREFYIESTKKRNEYIARRISETLKADETGLLFFREGHQLQFVSDIQVIYVSPPALDEISRWLRDHEVEPGEK
jgi:hypothetical protein